MGLSGTVNTIIFDTSGRLYAGGSFKVNELSVSCCVASWNGKNWDTVGYGANITGTANDFAFDTSGNLLVGGHLTFSDGSNSFEYVGRWNGQKWKKVIQDVNISGSIYTIAATRYSLKIGGYFKIPWAYDTIKSILTVNWNGQINSNDDNSVEKVDGNFKPLTGFVYDIASSSDLSTTYIAGDFVMLNGIRHFGFNKSFPLEFVGAKGVGSALEAVGNDGVFLAGSFTTGYRSTSLMYTGRQFGDFNTLMSKSSTDGDINFLAYDSVYNRIYIGGDFISAGGLSSPCLARVDLVKDQTTATVFTNAKSSSVCNKVIFNFSGNKLSIFGIGSVAGRIEYYSLQGQLLYSNTIICNSGNFSTDIPRFAQNVSFVRIKPENGAYINFKFVK